MFVLRINTCSFQSRLPFCHRLNTSGNESIVSCFLAASTRLFFFIFKIFTSLSLSHLSLLTSHFVFSTALFPPFSQPKLPGEATDIRQEVSVYQWHVLQQPALDRGNPTQNKWKIIKHSKHLEISSATSGTQPHICPHYIWPLRKVVKN